MAVLVDLVLPRPCPCGARRALGARPAPLCRACYREVADGAFASIVRPYPPPRGLPVCAAAAPYGGVIRRLLIAYKERGRRDLAGLLAAVLARSVLALPRVQATARARGHPVLLVPVPSSRTAFRARGVDHLAVLARSTAAQLRRGGLRARWLGVLEPARRVADQVGLSTSARASNVAGSLRVVPGRGPFAGRGSPVVVLVDDILTSGATLGEAARALRAAGILPGGAAVVASAVRHTGFRGPGLSSWADTD